MGYKGMVMTAGAIIILGIIVIAFMGPIAVLRTFFGLLTVGAICAGLLWAVYAWERNQDKAEQAYRDESNAYLEKATLADIREEVWTKEDYDNMRKGQHYHWQGDKTKELIKP
jgi:hypothetical protein